MSFIEKIFSIKNKNINGFVYKVVTVLFIKFKFKTNKTVEQKQKNKLPFWAEVGEHTYGFAVEKVEYYTPDKNIKLIIGDYCSIGPHVHFILASEHSYKNFSTFPYKAKMLGKDFEALSKGNIVLKDDVWIGLGAIILSGITIGQGALVAAGSVVTKDVPPYAIVAGNPAKVVKYRFEPEVVEKLKNFDYSKLTEEKVYKLQDKLYTKITKDNVDEIIGALSV